MPWTKCRFSKFSPFIQKDVLTKTPKITSFSTKKKPLATPAPKIFTFLSISLLTNHLFHRCVLWTTNLGDIEDYRKNLNIFCETWQSCYLLTFHHFPSQVQVHHYILWISNQICVSLCHILVSACSWMEVHNIVYTDKRAILQAVEIVHMENLSSIHS